MTARASGWGMVLLAAVSGLGCTQMGQVKAQNEARRKYATGDYDGAVKVLEAAKEGKAYEPRDRVAYWMNLAMLQHHAKNYTASNALLEQASKRADELYTLSLSKTATTLFVNETMSDYQGENFERVMVHVLSSLNYIETGDLDNARVEAVKTTEQLKAMRIQAGDKPLSFSQDAFAEWLTGMIYEMQGDANDALISYKASAVAYRDVYGKYFSLQAPPFLGEDIVRAAEEVGPGFEDDIKKAKHLFPGSDGQTFSLLKDHGEVVVLHANGEAPEKKDFIVTCQANTNGAGCDFLASDTGFEKVRSFTASGDVFKMALPVFKPHPHHITGVRVSCEGQSTDGVRVEPVSDIAVKDLSDRMQRDFAKAIARTLAKFIAEKAGKKFGGETLGAVLKLVNNYNEEADKRSWSTLPAEFNVARMWLPPGEHDLALDFTDASGQVVRRQVVHTVVAAGKRAIVTVPTLE
jgi:hypothetical protein